MLASVTQPTTARHAVVAPIIWVNHSMKGLPIKLTTAYWTKIIAPPDAIRLANRLASFAAEELCGRPMSSVDFSEWIGFPISPQRALRLASALLVSAECELSGAWQ